MSHSPDHEFALRAREIGEAGRFLYERGWVPATSGNFSARLGDGKIAITVSGRNKGALSADDIMLIDAEGQPLTVGKRSSAETLLHTGIYRRFPAVGAVLHTHSMNATLLSRQFGHALTLAGYELLKAFQGIETHDTQMVVPIFPNDQEIPRLQGQVDEWLDQQTAPVFGYLIAGHGLYVWGTSVADALRHLEAFEFLFQCELHAQRMTHA